MNSKLQYGLFGFASGSFIANQFGGKIAAYGVLAFTLLYVGYETFEIVDKDSKTTEERDSQ